MYLLFLTRKRPGTDVAVAAALGGEQTEAITEARALVLDGGEVLVGAVLGVPAVPVLLAVRAHPAPAVVQTLLKYRPVSSIHTPYLLTLSRRQTDPSGSLVRHSPTNAAQYSFRPHSSSEPHLTLYSL